MRNNSYHSLSSVRVRDVISSHKEMSKVMYTLKNKGSLMQNPPKVCPLELSQTANRTKEDCNGQTRRLRE